MNADQSLLEQAKSRKIRIYEPFAKFLKGSEEEYRFEISLLDCYRLAGHACHSMTGAFLCAEAAVENLYPKDKTCIRGDLRIEFGSELNERATGPRSNLISYITGSWAETGFPGLRGEFERKGLVSYGNRSLAKNEILFRSLSRNKSVIVGYNPNAILDKLSHGLDFPDSWRVEIDAILKNSANAVTARPGSAEQSCGGSKSPNGCC